MANNENTLNRASDYELKRMLEAYWVSGTKIQMIQKRFDDPVASIKKNPYVLSNEGMISFNQADQIAKDMGFDAMDDRRIESAFIFVLEKIAASQGHTYLMLDEMVKKSLYMLNGRNNAMYGSFDESFIKQKIGECVKRKVLVNDNGRIYRTFRYENECIVAEHIAGRGKLKSQFSDISEEFIAGCLKKGERQLGITLADKQREAAMTAAKNMTMILTGGPGMGKTTCLKAILNTLDQIAVEVGKPPLRKLLAAPSGMAAKRMQESTGIPASTIHRMLEYTQLNNGEVRCKNEQAPLDADIIVIDESSMLDIDLMRLVLDAVKDETMLIFVGDTDQLPSVGAGNVLYDLISSEAIPVVRLNHTYRQGTESAIVTNAAKINKGETNLITRNGEFHLVSIPDDADNGNSLNEMVQRIFFEEFIENGEDISKIQILCPIRKQSDSITTNVVVNVLNSLLQDTVNPCIDSGTEMKYRTARYRKGDKIMQLANNYDKNVFNGDIGVIVNVSPRQKKLKVDFAGQIVEYMQSELDQIMLSYATTIHKSQGSEYQCVIIPLSMQHKVMLHRNLIYTAITRAKNKVYVVGDMKALDLSIQNISNTHRNSYLAQRIRARNI